MAWFPEVGTVTGMRSVVDAFVSPKLRACIIATGKIDFRMLYTSFALAR